MRLLTRNLCRGQLDRKHHAVAAVGYDIAVLQEVAKLESQSAHACWFGSNPRQGMAVLTSPAYTLHPLPWDEELPQLIVPIEVRGPRCFTLLAVWALHHEKFRYIRAVSIAIDRYASYFESGPVVLLGDFNANRIWDSKHPSDKSFTGVATRLRARGLVSAYHHHRSEAYGEESASTFYLQWNKDKAYHIDYCFLPEEWAERVESVEVPAYDEWRSVSDHRPLAVEVRDSDA
jgi:endonuclease/exonuclease/phosphatase family metal-dependent hydrolase